MTNIDDHVRARHKNHPQVQNKYSPQMRKKTFSTPQDIRKEQIFCLRSLGPKIQEFNNKTIKKN